MNNLQIYLQKFCEFRPKLFVPTVCKLLPVRVEYLPALGAGNFFFVSCFGIQITINFSVRYLKMIFVVFPPVKLPSGPCEVLIPKYLGRNGQATSSAQSWEGPQRQPCRKH